MTSLILSKPADHTPEKFFSPEQKNIIKNTICKGLTDNDLNVFLYACARTGLDPFMRQIYAVARPAYQGAPPTMTIQTGIDGYRLIAERTRRYAPGKPTEFAYDKEGRLFSATSYVKKQTCDGTWHEVSATAIYCEYVQTKKDGSATKFWSQMGHTMISKCAEALALRKAFPAELSGVYTSEEMQQQEKECTDPKDLPVTVAEEIREELKQISQDRIAEEQKYIVSFVEKWDGERNEIEEYLKACSKHYKDKSMYQIVLMLESDLATTCKNFDTWKMRKVEKQVKVG